MMSSDDIAAACVCVFALDGPVRARACADVRAARAGGSYGGALEHARGELALGGAQRREGRRVFARAPFSEN